MFLYIIIIIFKKQIFEISLPILGIAWVVVVLINYDHPALMFLSEKEIRALDLCYGEHIAIYTIKCYVATLMYPTMNKGM